MSAEIVENTNVLTLWHRGHRVILHRNYVQWDTDHNCPHVRQDGTLRLVVEMRGDEDEVAVCGECLFALLKRELEEDAG